MNLSKKPLAEDTATKRYLERSHNELILAQANFLLSTDQEAKKLLGVPQDMTFYHNIISQSYYAIFYAAKAFLKSQGITTCPPSEHQKTYNSFKKLILTHSTLHHLGTLYDEEAEKAQSLLDIFIHEKSKRGRFTYQLNAQANKPFAQESVRNAKIFSSSIRALLNNLS